MPTKDELEQELDRANARIAELEQGAEDAPPGTAANPIPPEPKRPDFGLSAGELDDLRNAGVTTSPFTGEVLNALDEGVEPANPEARRNAEREQKRRRDEGARGEDVHDHPAPAAG